MTVREYVDGEGCDEFVVVCISWERGGEKFLGEMEYYDRGVLNSHCPNHEEYNTQIKQIQKGEEQTLLVVE